MHLNVNNPINTECQITRGLVHSMRLASHSWYQAEGSAAQSFRYSGLRKRDDWERSLRKGASLGEEAFLADSRQAGEKVGTFSSRPEFAQDTASHTWNYIYSKLTEARLLLINFFQMVLVARPTYWCTICLSTIYHIVLLLLQLVFVDIHHVLIYKILVRFSIWWIIWPLSLLLQISPRQTKALTDCKNFLS